MLSSMSAALVSGSTISSGAGNINASLRWRKGTIKIGISDSFLKRNVNLKTDSDVIGAIRRSLATWTKVTDIDLQESISEKQNVSPSGNQGDGVSLITIAATPENLLLFSKSLQETAATTRLFFDRKGFITEADIVLNPYQQFSTDGTFGTFDLESTLTHEIGHLLGLDHSPVLSAVMHDNAGKNGVFGLQNFVPRTLALTDIAAIRAKYGADIEDALECCGAISGKILRSSELVTRGVEIWAEEPESGKLVAETSTGAGGAFKLDGLPTGNYNIYAQRSGKLKINIPTQKIGNVFLESGDTSFLIKRLVDNAADFELKYLGFNGQLSGLPVPLNAGKSYTVYMGGRNIDKDQIYIGFSSPFLTCQPNTLINVDYGDGISAVSFEVQVNALTPIGEYTVFVESKVGMRQAIVGGIAIRSFSNSFSNFILPEN